MTDLSSMGIDKNDLLLKIDKLEGYIRKAKNRLMQHEQSLELIYSQQFGNKDVIETSLKRLKMMSKRRSLR